MTINAFSIDLEDWFCVQNLTEVIPFEQWDGCESRIEKNTRRLLDTLKQHDVRGTFFVLGWIAERYPGLVRAIAAGGHEIASHGYGHLIVKHLQPQEFEADLTKSLDILTQITGVRPIGYRAPSFSVDTRKMWIFDILARHGIKYDSSVFPFKFHPDYGNDQIRLSPYNLSDGMIEFPMGCFKVFRWTVPCCGGGYFRLFPYRFISYGIRQCNREGRPVAFYIHPWEIDDKQPRVKIAPVKSFRHYVNLDKTLGRLEKLLDEFRFDAYRTVLNIGES
ncbi:MAG: DUF3473 domain-containing protein [Chitinivibrionales bacterium]|nr:DUF3473 domain-containing protein [Chitinivibrionales bacterium]